MDREHLMARALDRESPADPAYHGEAPEDPAHPSEIPEVLADPEDPAVLVALVDLVVECPVGVRVDLADLVVECLVEVPAVPVVPADLSLDNKILLEEKKLTQLV